VSVGGGQRWEVGKDEAALRYAFDLGARFTEMEDVKKATGSVVFNSGKVAQET